MAFIQRTPAPNARAAQRRRQRQYAQDLGAQVADKQSQQMRELAKQHADRYKVQFGLADQIAQQPGSGFSLSPRYPLRPEVPAAGAGGQLQPQRRQQPGAGRQLSRTLTHELEERFRHLHKAFLAADVDRSGSLDVAELRRLCMMYNLPTEQVQAAFALSDIDGNGRIEYHEFAKQLSRPDYTQASMPLPGMRAGGPGGPGGGGNGSGNAKAGLGNMPRGFVNPALAGGAAAMATMQGTRAPNFSNALNSMWQGGGPSVQEQRAKRAQQSDYVSVLEQQIAEKKARQRKAKQLEAEDERRAEEEARRYNPWGRGGGGAPLQDETGRMITDLRDLHEVANLGGISPKADRGGGNGAGGGGNGVGRVGGGNGTGYNRMLSTQYGSPTRMRGAVIPQNTASGPGMLPNELTGNGRYRMANAPPEKQAEYMARATKQDALKNQLAQQIEEKRRRQALEKQRRLELERREEERVRREQEEIRTQYLIEHRAAQKKEQDLQEANRQAAEQAKQRSQAAQQQGGDPFSPKRATVRTPPPGPEAYVGAAARGGGGGGSGGRGRRGGGGGGGGSGGMSMSVLRRELNDQHGALLRKIEEQRATVETLRNQIQQFQNGGAAGAGGGYRGAGAGAGAAGGGGGAYGGGGLRYGGGGGGRGYGGAAAGRGRPNAFAALGDGKNLLNNEIDFENDEALENLLMDFVNKKGGYGPQMPEIPSFNY